MCLCRNDDSEISVEIALHASLEDEHMSVHKLIANGSFGPAEIKLMMAACEAALIDLRLADGDDPINELIAKAIINVTPGGERDPSTVKERAINALGVRKSDAA